ncbi:MAG TPA: HlyD family efflux transporter periplasmic adaptor subunit [Lacipirellulaceae bacterium]|nr:HlyD family efflux transporter periplasmic adaptor subunit [Lacipirellulaceae bacterium]
MNAVVRRVMLVLFAAAVVGAIGYGLMPGAVEADLAPVTRGLIRETVDQDGKTRIRERYTVSAPLAGRLLRIGLDPGDEVIAGETIVASIEPRDPELLDARAVLQAEANVRAAEAKLKRMTPMLEEAIAAQEYAESELKRIRDVRTTSPQAASESQVDAALMDYRMRSALVRSARHAEEIARFELDQARAALVRSRPAADGDAPGAASADSAESDPPAGAVPADEAVDRGDAGDDPGSESRSGEGWHFTIPAPITGRVLRVFQESTAVVAAGANLLELGDPSDLEVEIDVLSREAVKIRADAPVLLEQWGGDKPLAGRVRLVEPSAFTKISTLGVEEQRVNVIVDLMDEPRQRAALGDGFRVEARIVVAEAADVLRVPTSARVRVGDAWAGVRGEEGIAVETIVAIGLQNGLEAEVIEQPAAAAPGGGATSPLAEGDLVIAHPGDNVVDGVRITPR